MLNKNETTILIPKFAILNFIIFGTLFGMIAYEQYQLFKIYGDFILTEKTSIILLSIGVLFFILWSYSILSVLKNTFKKDINKIAWLIALIILPPTALFYSDIKDLQIEK